MNKLPEGERLRLLLLNDRALAEVCEVDLYRASGSGGQKRNKTSSAVRMRHVLSGVVSKADDSRSQHENRRKALIRLRENLALDLREPVLPGYSVSNSVAEVLRKGALGKNSKTRSQTAYLLVIAEILDVFSAEDAVVSRAAILLGVTTAKLSKFLCGDDRIARRVMEMRSQRGMRPLRS